MEKSPSRFSGHFRDASADWRVDVTDEPVGVAAAWMQYRLARRIWTLVDLGRIDIAVLARDMGQSAEAQRKKLSGAQPASLRDFAGWIMAIGGPAYEVLPREDSDLFPDAARRMLAGWSSGNGRLPRFDSTDGLVWGHVVVCLGADVVQANSHDRTHLLTHDWVRQRAIDHMSDIGIHPHKLRLKSLDDAAALQMGVADPVNALFDLVGRDEATGADSAVAAAQRLRRHIASVATSVGRGVLVVVALGSLGESVFTEALSSLTGEPEFVLGPFEPRDVHPLSAWWANHSISLGRVAVERYSDVGVVAAIRVGKVTPV